VIQTDREDNQGTCSLVCEGFLVPLEAEFDSENRILRFRLEGTVTDESLNECYREIGKYAALTAPSTGILDLSKVTSFEVSPETIRRLADLPPAIPDPRPPRVIIAPSPHVFGIARMFEIHGQDTRPSLHVVRTESEAFAILGILEPHFEPVQSE
jgi:hypothetical protein